MDMTTPLYRLTGVVIHGRGVGKHVGTPTADLALGPGSHLPPGGVYASRAASGGAVWYGVTSVGRRPTLHDDRVPSVETHLFDFSGDLYGQPLTLELHHKLREIQRFDDLTQLLEQIRQDCMAARAFWGLGVPGPILRMDTARHHAALNGQELRLSPKEFEVLWLLCCASGKVLTKEAIYQAVWREPSNGCLLTSAPKWIEIYFSLFRICPRLDFWGFGTFSTCNLTEHTKSRPAPLLQGPGGFVYAAGRCQAFRTGRR